MYGVFLVTNLIKYSIISYAIEISNDLTGHILLFTGVKPLMSNNIYKETICINLTNCVLVGISIVGKGITYYLF